MAPPGNEADLLLYYRAGRNPAEAALYGNREHCRRRQATRQIYFCITGPVAIPPRLLFTEIESTAGDTVNVPVYLPPPALESVPIRAPVAAFHTVSVADAFVLVASTRSWNERSTSSALVIRTESRA